MDGARPASQSERGHLEHYRRKLATEADEAKRQVLARLLAEEEAKLVALENLDKNKRGQGE